jgi:two-component system response regulator FlrC
VPEKRVKKILIVDDEAPIRKTVAKIGQSIKGVECLLASSSAEALKLFSENDIDLVITDVNMPGATGIDVLLEVKKSGKKVPVVIFSGSLVEGQAAKISKMGADMVLSKPASVRTLKSAMTTWSGLAEEGS